jgi:hypothetical protein
VAGAAVNGPLRFEADGVRYAGALRVVDIDDDTGVTGVHAQARALRGWAGVAADITTGKGGFHADVTCSGDAGDAAADALLAAARERLGASLADDPVWRRKLAVRAAVAVGIGVAAGLAGAAWDRRRRG